MDVWKVLVVDADGQTLTDTVLALARLEYLGRAVIVFKAFSASDARAVVSVHPDMAATFVDLGLEGEATGLDFIKWLRLDLDNWSVQVVARLSRPLGEGDEALAQEFEIADFQEKKGLSPVGIRLSALSALRAHEALKTLSERHGDLRRVIEASSHVFRNVDVPDFERETLTCLGSILHGPGGTDRRFGLFASRTPDETVPRITTATGRFRHLEGQKLNQLLDPAAYAKVLSHDYSKGALSIGKLRVYGFRVRDSSEVFIVLEDNDDSTEWNLDLLEAFTMNLAVAVDNFRLFSGMENARNDLVFALGEMAESRSEETWNHVKRVAEIVQIIAQGLGMGEFETEQLRMAASLHDLGKLSISEDILAKEGKLSEEEFEAMKSHAKVGFEMLKTSNRGLFRTAAQIALEHHENWDGTGYPRGLRGEEISLYSRIVTVADVFDALGNRRAYKKPWQTPDILEFMYRETGRKFDPRVMDVFFERVDELSEVRHRFPD